MFDFLKRLFGGKTQEELQAEQAMKNYRKEQERKWTEPIQASKGDRFIGMTQAEVEQEAKSQDYQPTTNPQSTLITEGPGTTISGTIPKSKWEIMEENRPVYTADLLKIAKDAGFKWKEGPYLTDTKRRKFDFASTDFNGSLNALVNEMRYLYRFGDTIHVHTPEHCKYYSIQFYKRGKK